MLDYSNFEVGSFQDFYLPVVDVMLVHDVVRIIVFINSNRSGDLYCALLIIFKDKILVPVRR